VRPIVAHTCGLRVVGEIDPRTLAFGRALRAVRRRALLIVASVAIGALAGYGVSRALPVEYVATAQLYVAPASNQNASFQDVVAGANVARSFVQLATTTAVLRPAMTAQGWDDIEAFRSRASATQLRDASIIAISFRDTDATRAAATANAIAQSFITQNHAVLSTIQRPAVGILEAQIRSVETDIAALDAQIRDLQKRTVGPGQSPSPDNAALQVQIQQLDSARSLKQQTLAQLLKTRDDMDLAAARAESTVTLYDPATAPDEPASPRVPLNVAVGGMLGGVVGLVAVATVAYVRERITSLDAVGPSLGVAPLGEIPALAARPKDGTRTLIMRDDVDSSAAQSFRSLRASVLSTTSDKQPAILLISSARAGEGKSFVSANLALALAEAGTTTILVDADLRNPSQHELFGVDRNAGLTDLLEGSLSAMDLPQGTVSGLTVIPAGSPVRNPAKLLTASRLGPLLRTLSERSGGSVLVLDTSPLLSFADALAFASESTGCVMIVDAKASQPTTVRRAIALLRRVNALVIGVVVNRVVATDDPYPYVQVAAGPRDPHARR